MASQPAARSGVLGKRVLALALGLIAAPIACELGLRVDIALFQKDTFAALGTKAARPSPGEKALLGQLIRTNPNESIIYEF